MAAARALSAPTLEPKRTKNSSSVPNAAICKCLSSGRRSQRSSTAPTAISGCAMASGVARRRSTSFTPSEEERGCRRAGLASHSTRDPNVRSTWSSSRKLRSKARFPTPSKPTTPTCTVRFEPFLPASFSRRPARGFNPSAACSPSEAIAIAGPRARSQPSHSLRLASGTRAFRTREARPRGLHSGRQAGRARRARAGAPSRRQAHRAAAGRQLPYASRPAASAPPSVTRVAAPRRRPWRRHARASWPRAPRSSQRAASRAAPAAVARAAP
eukprot:scaffold36677_cov25-Tisochrysis_lutea.AAC.1